MNLSNGATIDNEFFYFIEE